MPNMYHFCSRWKLKTNKVEGYSKTNCAGWTGTPQGFQIYFVWNPRKSDMEGPYKLLPAEPAKPPNLACWAGRSLYGPSMSYLLGFQTKYILNPWGIPVHPIQVPSMSFANLLDSPWPHCVKQPVSMRTTKRELCLTIESTISFPTNNCRPPARPNSLVIRYSLCPGIV